jgi:amino acid adenylation domain-containing protein
MSKELIEDIYPLSPLQQGLLYHALRAPASDVYFEQFVCTLRGPLKVTAFKQAWQQALDRHSSLRTVFVWEDVDEPLQIVYRKVELPFELEDWRGLSSPSQAEELAATLARDRSQGFELKTAPLMRLKLLRIAEDAHHLVWSHHHLLLDGWSMSMLLREIFDFYEAYSRNQDLALPQPRPYCDYIAWLQQQSLPEAESYWRRELGGFTAPTLLNADLSVNAADTAEEYGEIELQLSDKLTGALQSLGARSRLTLNTLVQGCWAVLLSRYSGEQDIIFGVTVAGRPATLSGVESMIGLFINTLPVRISVAGETPLLAWLAGLQDKSLESRQFEYSSLAQVQSWSAVPPGTPLFESLLVFENYLSGASLEAHNTTLKVCDVRAFERTNYPLTLVVRPGSALSLRLLYDKRRFADATIAQMLGHVQALLEGIADGPERRLGDLNILTAAEREQILIAWNDTASDQPPNQCAHELFEARARQTPDAVAVRFGVKQLTYRELDDRANRLASYLRSLGVGDEPCVGLCVERSFDMVVGVLGILKAGGAYVPLDPSFPPARLELMLETAQAKALLTQQRLLDRLPAFAGSVVCLDTEWDRQAGIEWESPVRPATPDNLAYVIFTSGSTGAPKGIAMPHRALVNLILWQAQTTTFKAPANTLQFSSLSFDASFQEMFFTWHTGGTLVLIEERLRRDAFRLWELVKEARIARIFLPFVALQQLALAAATEETDYPPLREFITAGEQLQVSREVISLFEKLPDCELHNAYGPSETHVVTVHVLEGVARHWPALPPIGRPIANTQAYLLDARLQPVPIGATGELYFGGVSLARGYINRPDLTADRFRPDPFSAVPGARVYRTGDLARYLPDGNLAFLGRADEQIKLRGYRIELAEIEAALLQLPQVKAAAVVLRRNEGVAPRLVAYVVGQPGHNFESAVLQAHLQEKLPEYMVPTVFISLERLPLTPTGKVNRRALPPPAPTEQAGLTDYVAPSTATERVLAGIWGQVLGRNQIGIHDNFFQLGGQSLLAMQLVSRVRDIFQVEFPLDGLFKAPTVKGLARELAALLGSPSTVELIAQTVQEVKDLSGVETTAAISN